jgi:hypothetical protein
MERLEEYKADRKSKSLEETKGSHLGQNNDLIMQGGHKINVTTYLSEDGGAAPGGQGKWASQFRSMTEYDKKRHDSVKAFVDALHRLEER